MILFLIGFRATGKTTIGHLLAHRVGCRWVDTDAEIQAGTGRTIPEILAADGEPVFREIEQRVVARFVDELQAEADAVMSLGGGAVLSETTRQLLRQHGKCVLLTASAACLTARIESGQDDTPRPALTNLEPAEEVARLLAKRLPVYSGCADYTIDTEASGIEEAVEQIAQWWQGVDK